MVVRRCTVSVGKSESMTEGRPGQGRRDDLFSPTRDSRPRTIAHGRHARPTAHLPRQRRESVSRADASARGQGVTGTTKSPGRP
jgi:hypothetical protein